MQMLGAIPIGIWAPLLGLGLAVCAGVWLGERKAFARRGKVAAWRWVRLATLPILAATAAIAWLPAQAVGGPEALAVFYLCLLFVCPVVYFGLHVWLGRWVSPVLIGGEALGIAATGLLPIAVPVAAAHLLQPWYFEARAAVAEAGRLRAPVRPRPHRIVDERRFLLPEIGEVWAEHWLAPGGVRVERIESRHGGEFSRADDSSGGGLCRAGDDVYLFWSAAALTPHWRMFWRDESGELLQSEWTSQPAAGPAEHFELRWSDAGLRLPARIPLGMVALARVPDGGVESFDGLLGPGAVYDPLDNCLPLDLRWPAKPGWSAPQALRIAQWCIDLQAMRFATFRRP